jgi:hypothetical protein
MKLERSLQLSILSEFSGHYPKEFSVGRLKCFIDSPDFNWNIMYLEEHGLIAEKSQDF